MAVAEIIKIWPRALCAAALILAGTHRTCAQAGGPPGAVNLLQRYPTALTAGDTIPARARPWQFSPGDIFQLSRFTLDTAKNLRLEAGPCDLGVGHCADGAVWAVVIPRQEGKLTSQALSNQESIAHVWLRFHPAQINLLFPPGTVSDGGATNLLATMRAIAGHKFTAAFHAGDNALIPDPNDLVVDVDTGNGARRFFVVDRKARMAAYVNAFEKQAFKPHPVLTPELAESAFDQLWDTFDGGYAMFVLRPEVDWAKLRDQYRPKALACQSSDDFAAVCAEMLRPLRDLNVCLMLAGTGVPVFDRARRANSNPAAHKTILGSLTVAGRLQWAVTSDQIGFIGIYGWDDEGIPDQFDKVLERMRETRGLIVDVRWNAGGSEALAEKVAGRFLTNEVVYAYDQFRDGLNYTNLTKKTARKVQPSGPWRYERPVILLIGQKCMGASEAFVGMMTRAPSVTTMGDHTAGSSGNPQVVRLPLDMTVSVPQWIDYKPDGTPLDEHGFEPQVPYTPGPDAFAEKHDDLLGAALARLRQGR